MNKDQVKTAILASLERRLSRKPSAAEKQVALGYADSWWGSGEEAERLRNLRFRTEWVSRADALILVACGPVEYNRYTAQMAMELIEGLPEDVTVSFGREGSPVMYIHGADANLLMKFQREDIADEMSLTLDGELRLWWD